MAPRSTEASPSPSSRGGDDGEPTAASASSVSSLVDEKMDADATKDPGGVKRRPRTERDGTCSAVVEDEAEGEEKKESDYSATVASTESSHLSSSCSSSSSQGTLTAESRSPRSHPHPTERAKTDAPSPLFPATVVLPLLVMIDMFAVSLVVPLLHQYYRSAGIDSARRRELLSSLFSSSQIVGGLCIGMMSDAGTLSRRNTLLLSFAGSAASYGLIVVASRGGVGGDVGGGVATLVFSRVLVGLVKQTMTVSTALLAGCTAKEERAAQMGRLTASSTVAWIVGPSAGALLYKHVDESAPAAVACILFIINSLLAAALLPRHEQHVNKDAASKTSTRTTPRSTSSKMSSFASNLRSCFASPSLASAVTSLLIFHWVTRATSYASMASYYEERFGLEPHHRGYLSSYQQLLSFGVQSSLVRPLLRWTGGERRAAVFGAASLAVLNWIEMQTDLKLFVLLVCPAVAVSLSLLSLSLKSLVTLVAPRRSLGSVLAALDVLQNAAAVTVPFYRTALFEALGRFSTDDDAAMRGDPDPRLWLTSSMVHWAAAATVLGGLLLASSPGWKAKGEESCRVGGGSDGETIDSKKAR